MSSKSKDSALIKCSIGILLASKNNHFFILASKIVLDNSVNFRIDEIDLYASNLIIA